MRSLITAVLAGQICCSLSFVPFTYRPRTNIPARGCLEHSLRSPSKIMFSSVKMFAEDDKSSDSKRLPDAGVVFVPSKSIPRLPSPDTPQKTRIRIAELLKDVHTPTDILAEMLHNTKQAFDFQLERIAEGASETSKVATPLLRPRVVVLGSGWGAEAISEIIDTKKFDVTFISPRSYFIFTPMLASASVGTVEYHSICKSMRTGNPSLNFYEAAVTDVDTALKTVTCIAAVEGAQPFQVPYDFLVTGIGMQSSTFNTPGVLEHCFFLKEIEDAKRLRAGIVEAFEAASLPGLSEDELRQRLAFVVVGGGPTGVEFSGELFDFIQQDLKRFYPRLVPYISTTMLHSGDGILEQFGGALQAIALGSLRREGTNVVLGARVVEVGEHELVYRLAGIGNNKGTETRERLPYGLCVWACGNQPRPLAHKIIQQLQPAIASKRGRIVTDGWLRVAGASDGSVFAIGDCAEPETGPLPQTGQVAAQQGAFVARLLNNEVPSSAADCSASIGPPSHRSRLSETVQGTLVNAAAEGDLVARALIQSRTALAAPFHFVPLGILAYLGSNNALAKVEVGAAVGIEDRDNLTLATGGSVGWLLWRFVYLTKQVAFENRVLVLFDWVKSKIFGRDIACL